MADTKNAPPPERTLTREEYELAVRGEYDQPGQLVRGVKDLLAHDAALRERLVRAEAAVQDHNLLCERNDKALRARWFEEKARVAALTAALREIADFAHCDAEGFIVQPCPCPLCALSLRIAREALARIEEGK